MSNAKQTLVRYLDYCRSCGGMSLLAAVTGALVLACASHQPGNSPGSGRTITRVTSPAVDTRITSDRRVSRHVIDAPIQEAWAALVAVYQELEIQLEYADSASRRLGNSVVRSRRIGGQRLSRYFECGQASMGRPRADQYDVTYSISSRIVTAEDGRIVLLTELDGSARPTSVSTNPIHCASKGTLEQRIASRVSDLLNSGNSMHPGASMSRRDAGILEPFPSQRDSRCPICG